jgi:site-specific DNA recombinase
VYSASRSDGVTAWKTGVRRPGFETLLERAGTGASQGIAVWHVDRLFRSHETWNA